jgi:hypothetical protein
MNTENNILLSYKNKINRDTELKNHPDNSNTINNSSICFNDKLNIIDNNINKLNRDKLDYNIYNNINNDENDFELDFDNITNNKPLTHNADSLTDEEINKITKSSNQKFLKSKKVKKEYPKEVVKRFKNSLRDFTPESICDAILQSNGNLIATSKILNVPLESLKTALKKSKNKAIYQNAVDQGRNQILDIAELKLVELLQSPDPRISLDAVKFVLNSRIAKDRGFSQKQELEIEHNIGLTVPDISIIKSIKDTLINSIDTNFVEIEADTISNQEQSNLIDCEVSPDTNRISNED